MLPFHSLIWQLCLFTVPILGILPSNHQAPRTSCCFCLSLLPYRLFLSSGVGGGQI